MKTVEPLGDQWGVYIDPMYDGTGLLGPTLSIEMFDPKDDRLCEVVRFAAGVEYLWRSGQRATVTAALKAGMVNKDRFYDHHPILVLVARAILRRRKIWRGSYGIRLDLVPEGGIPPKHRGRVERQRDKPDEDSGSPPRRCCKPGRPRAGEDFDVKGGFFRDFQLDPEPGESKGAKTPKRLKPYPQEPPSYPRHSRLATIGGIIIQEGLCLECGSPPTFSGNSGLNLRGKLLKSDVRQIALIYRGEVDQMIATTNMSENEPFIRLKDAFPDASYRTIWGYTVHGVAGEVLKAVKRGNRLFTKRSWVASWLAAVNAKRQIPTRV
jgi:hypothetical protein